MAKKKAKKKKTVRKAATKPKKAAARKTTKRTAAKKTRKPARKPARAAKSPRKSAKKVVGAGAPFPPPVPFTIIPGQCSIQPPSQHFPPPPMGSVIFNCAADCKLIFSHPEVLGLTDSEQSMTVGSHEYPIVVLSGHTEFFIKGCAVENGPGDIIVP